MNQPRNRLDEFARGCLVLGAILLLIGNLLAAAGRYALVIIGGILVGIGVVCSVVAWVASSRTRSGRR